MLRTVACVLLINWMASASAYFHEFDAVTFNMQGVTSLGGLEHVWIDQIHPFMQANPEVDVMGLQEAGRFPDYAALYSFFYDPANGVDEDEAEFLADIHAATPLALGNNGVITDFYRFNAVTQTTNIKRAKIRDGYIAEYDLYIYHAAIDDLATGERTNLALVSRQQAKRIIFIPPIYNQHSDSLSRRPTLSIVVNSPQTNRETLITTAHMGSHSFNQTTEYLQLMHAISTGSINPGWPGLGGFTTSENSAEAWSGQTGQPLSVNQATFPKSFGILMDSNYNLLGLDYFQRRTALGLGDNQPMFVVAPTQKTHPALPANAPGRTLDYVIAGEYGQAAINMSHVYFNMFAEVLNGHSSTRTLLSDHIGVRVYHWVNHEPSASPDGHYRHRRLNTQAEDASTQSNTWDRTVHAGYDGTGFLDYGGRGSYAEWDIELEDTGYYDLRLNYANAGGANRTSKLSVFKEIRIFGSTFRILVGQANLAFARTGSNWANWGVEEVAALRLLRGRSVLRIEATTNAGGPNLDDIEFYQRDEVHIEAEEEFTNLAGNATSTTASRGYTGSGALALSSNTAFEARTSFLGVRYPSCGRYSISFRYANGTSHHRTMSFAMWENGGSESFIDWKLVHFPPTGDWENWAESTLETNILSPQHQVNAHLMYYSDASLPRLDNIKFNLIEPRPCRP